MAKKLIFVEQQMLNRMVGCAGNVIRHETEECFYVAFGGPYDEKIELVSSPRPVDRGHLKRDFKSTLEDMETSLRHLRYMYEEL
jgi:hypothetical protein